MGEGKGSATARAVRGIEAAAFVLRHSVQSYAVAGGEGARRLAAELAAAQSNATPPTRLDGEGLEAARAALGAAAAGQRVALLVSGPALLGALPAIKEMVRLSLPVLIVVASHGDDEGGTLPRAGLHDVAHLKSLAVGVLVAADGTQVGDFLLAALRASVDRAAPYVVAFDLARVGLLLSTARLPDASFVQSWAAASTPHAASAAALPAPHEDLEGYSRETARFGFALAAAFRELERALRRPMGLLIGDGLRDAEIIVVSVGPAAAAARHAVPHMHHRGGRRVGALQIAALQPFPAAELVRLIWRAQSVIVHEALHEPLGVGGTVTDSVRASFADALTWHPQFTGIGRIPPVATVLGDEVTADQWIEIAHTIEQAADPPRLLAAGPVRGSARPELRIDIVMDDAGRDDALRLVVDWLARTGTQVSAHAQEPTRTGISIAHAAPAERMPPEVLVVCQGAGYNVARLETLPRGALVVLAGDFEDRVLAETIRVAAARGVRVAHLGGHGEEALPARVALAAVLRALLPIDAAGEAALLEASRDADVAGGEALLARVRTLGAALHAQVG